MNDSQAERLLDKLGTMNQMLARIVDQLEKRQTYKPLILALPNRDLNREEFGELDRVIRDYFDDLEVKTE